MLRTSLARILVLGAITTTIVALWPGLAQASVVADWEMTDVGAPPPTMTDSSNLGNNGTVSGGVVGDGKVFTFDGTGVAVVPDTSELNPASRNVAVTAVISFTKIPARDYDIVRKKPSGVKGMQYRMEIMSTGKAKCFFTGDTGNSAVTARPVLNDGKYHTITCTKTSSTIGVTVDGRVKTKSVTIGSITNSQSISIGAKAEGGDDFVGSIDAVTIDYT
jgi:Concanavalin A-like lectin/glucanases superfamily